MSGHSILEMIRAWSEKAPEHEAVIFQSSAMTLERLTYSELQQRVDERTQLFTELPPQSRVGLIAPHGPGFLMEALAILAAGHCLVPIGENLSGNERNELAVRAGIHALRDISRPGYAAYPENSIDGRSDEDFRALEPAYLRFTSGSTGPRKGVLLGHPTILERTAAANVRLKISPSDRVLCLLPMVDHFVVSILLYLRYGATVLLSAEDVASPEFAGTGKATVLYGSPAQYRHFTQPLPHVRLAVSTTQGLSTALAKTFLSQTGKPLTQALGIIEAGLLTLNETDAATDPLLAGRPMPDYQISIVGEKGCPGEIHVSGPGLLDAYVSPWRIRSSLLLENKFPTGDFGRLEPDGCLRLVGRKPNRLLLGGQTVFYEEIEALINQHPAVQESMVYQEKEMLVAEVVALKNLDDLQALTAAIRMQLASFSKPIDLRLVDSLPYTATGKLARPS